MSKLVEYEHLNTSGNEESETRTSPTDDNEGMKLGLISDTHIPDRCRSLPSSVAELFRDVDMILHAGDIGDLAVIRQLESIAPVLAVHGNDEPEATVRELPRSQTCVIRNRRLLLIHGHDDDRETEWALRRVDDWSQKLDHWAELGRKAGANIVVFGHTHVPMSRQHHGLTIVNPGALASGSYFARQVLRTVAVLHEEDGSISAVHHDVDAEGSSIVNVDHPWEAGFGKVLIRFHQPMYDPEVIDSAAWIREELYPIAPDAVVAAVDGLSQECWHGQRTWVTTAELMDRLLTPAESREPLAAKLAEEPRFREHLSRRSAVGR